MNNFFLDKLIEIKEFKNLFYNVLKYNFFYYFNKIEGSIFIIEVLVFLFDKNVVIGKYILDDV